MKELITKTLKDENIVNTALVTAGLMVNSVFSYLLQLFLARNLTVADFGTYNAILSLFAILSVTVTVMSVSLVKVVAELSGQKNHGKLTKLFWRVSAFYVIVGFLITCTLYLARNYLASYMNIEQPILYLYLGFYIFAGLISVGPQAFMQGLMKFRSFAFFASSMGLLRLVFPVVFVLLGYRVGGAYTGMALGMFSTFWLGLWLLRKSLSGWEKGEPLAEYKRIIILTLPVLLLNLCMMTLNNVDVILVKRYFDAVTAGYYAGVVILGKIILFGAGSITIVMFPQISNLVAEGKDHLQRLLFFFRILLLILLAAILSFSLLPNVVAKVFFGQQLLASARYLPWYAVFVAIYVLINFLMMYFIAINKTRISLILVPAVISQFVVINLFHSSIFSIIYTNISIALIILVTLSIYLYKISNNTARQNL